MRRNLTFISATALAAIAMLGLGAYPAAAADPQPDCAGEPNPSIVGFWVQTEPDTAFADSELNAGAVLCGNDDTIPGSGYTEATVSTPEMFPNVGTRRGMKIRCANPANPAACTYTPDVASGRFVGDVTMDIMLCYLSCNLVNNTHSKVYVDQKPGGQPNSHCVATYNGKPVIQCLQGYDDLGLGYSDILMTRINQGADNTGRYRMYLFQPMTTMPGARIYYSKIGCKGVWRGRPIREYGCADGQDEDPMHICKYAGSVNGSQCGSDPNDWLQRNGPANPYICGAVSPGMWFPNGWYVKATRDAGPAPNQKCATDKWVAP